MEAGDGSSTATVPSSSTERGRLFPGSAPEDKCEDAPSLTSVDEDDAYIARALGLAAEQTHPEPGDKSFLEKRLAEVVVSAFTSSFFRSEAVVRDKKLQSSVLPGWDPQPGTIDVAVITPEREPRIVFELKVDDVEWTLWDLFKMVAASTLPTVEAAYLVVAAKTKIWNSKRECVELFDFGYREEPEGKIEETEWYSRFFFSHWSAAWRDLLGGGSGRLIWVPQVIWTRAIGRWKLPHYPEYELRAIRAYPSSLTTEELHFRDGWPVPAPPPPPPRYEGQPVPIATAELRIEDLPGTSARSDSYHRFALSFNGYERMGSLRRCGRIANESIEHWRRTGELPDDLDELRACLFFEQRRWHHYGDDFDEGTMRYLEALVGKLRRLLEERASGESPPASRTGG